MKKKAIFLDRDGTINRETHYLSGVHELRLIGGAAEAIRLFNEEGWTVIVVTNQSAVARGHVTEEGLEEIHRALEDRLLNRGARVHAIYHCPHHPTAGREPYRSECGCRKPRPGMLRAAARDWGLDLGASYLVGDRATDLEAGRAAGCRTVLVRTGYGRGEEAGLTSGDGSADHVADDLLEAARWILSAEGGTRS